MGIEHLPESEAASQNSRAPCVFCKLRPVGSRLAGLFLHCEALAFGTSFIGEGSASVNSIEKEQSDGAADTAGPAWPRRSA